MKTLNRNKRIMKIIAVAAALALLAAVFAGCGKKTPDEPDYGFAVAMARTTSTANGGTGTRLTAVTEGETFTSAIIAEISGKDVHFTQTLTDEDGEHSICEVIVKDGKMYVAAGAVNAALRELYGAVYGDKAADMFPNRFITTDIDPEKYIGSIDPEALEEKLNELDDALIEAGIMSGIDGGFSIRSSAEELERYIKDTFEGSEYEEKLREAMDVLGSEGWSGSAGNITFSLKLDDFNGSVEAPAQEDTREIPVSSWLERLGGMFGQNANDAEDALEKVLGGLFGFGKNSLTGGE